MVQIKQLFFISYCFYSFFCQKYDIFGGKKKSPQIKLLIAKSTSINVLFFLEKNNKKVDN